MRLHQAMEGWGTDESQIVRLLSGLEGDQMAHIAERFAEIRSPRGYLRDRD